MSWSPAQYVEFEKQRTRPVRDLVAAIPAIDVRAMIDLGCGPGNSTEVLASRFPQASIMGLDGSADMIVAARERLPGVTFVVEDLQRWLVNGAHDGEEPSTFDVILANAVLQWVPDHATLLPLLVGRLARGGALAIQMPDNLAEPAHEAMRRVASHVMWREVLRDALEARAALETASRYYEILRGAGCRVDVWRTTYHHALPGGIDDVIEWFKGSGLRPFLSPLDATQRETFLAQYRQELAHAYPPLADGSVLLPFPRLFLVAVR